MTHLASRGQTDVVGMGEIQKMSVRQVINILPVIIVFVDVMFFMHLLFVNQTISHFFNSAVLLVEMVVLDLSAQLKTLLLHYCDILVALCVNKCHHKLNYLE